MVLVPDALELGVLAGHVDIFMGDAAITGARIAPHEPRVPVGDARTLQHAVTWRGQTAAKIRVLDDQLHVGVVEQQIIIVERGRVGAVERRIARLFKVYEGKAVEFSGDAALGEKGFDEPLRSVRGAGVADDPARDVRRNRGQATGQVGHLVFYDHIQTNTRRLRHFQTPAPMSSD